MKENREQKLIKYLRSLIFRSLLVIVLFLVAAIVSKISPTYKDKIMVRPPMILTIIVTLSMILSKELLLNQSFHFSLSYP